MQVDAGGLRHRLSEEELAVEIDQAVAMISSISKAVSGLDDGVIGVW